MHLLKTLMAFLLFWGVVVASLLDSFSRWLTAQLLGSKLKFATAFFVSAAIVIGLGIVFVRSQVAQQLPSQPLAFPHAVHAGQLGLDCAFCHRTAQTEPVAGVPAVEQCMFCHRVAGKEKPEVAKLLAAWEKATPLNWLRINRLPDTVHFDHSAHIRSDVTCATCHGPVAQMKEVTPVRSLKMGDCVECHRTRSAPTGCAACHY